MTTPATRYTEAQKADALRRYREGASCSAIAREIGADPTTVQKWVRGAGLMRPRGSYTDEQKAEALRLYRRGYSCRAAAQETGIDFRAVARWARQAGMIRKRTAKSAEQKRRSKSAHRAAAQAKERQQRQQRRARQELLHKVRAMRRRGLTLREIGERFGRSRQTIARWLRE